MRLSSERRSRLDEHDDIDCHNICLASDAPNESILAVDFLGRCTWFDRSRGERSSQIRRYSFDSLRIVLDTLGDDGDGSRADLW